jgi:hypothetical protein
MSQLIQTEGSFETTSSGFIERDQLGQSNKYNIITGVLPSPIQHKITETTALVVHERRNYTHHKNINWIEATTEHRSSMLSRYWLYKLIVLESLRKLDTTRNKNAKSRFRSMKGSGSTFFFR